MKKGVDHHVSDEANTGAIDPFPLQVQPRVLCSNPELRPVSLSGNNECQGTGVQPQACGRAGAHAVPFPGLEARHPEDLVAQGEERDAAAQLARDAAVGQEAHEAGVARGQGVAPTSKFHEPSSFHSMPAVPSTMTPPGCNSPAASAARMMPSPVRSLTEPPGFMNSALP
mgnify:CR=1 FL=1